MVNNFFYMNSFVPKTEEQINLLKNIKAIKLKQGITSKENILRSLAKTQNFTRSVFPEGWTFE
ncbi:MAG TPA: hypothetical protein PKN14_03455 [Bacteroidia bacterium]|nr:hypothetical protein [Bacteroidia bacterium]MBX3105597.1 hypothetical protein [Bacteroidota bacterium]MCB0849662.1 hypothetical protein [Bacteroidota bacterium]MCB8931162.1 hypothetical protein [Bacteroidia bacterium]MCW5930384.1 hypothetical protein [Bacteroidota bacterium]